MWLPFLFEIIVADGLTFLQLNHKSARRRFIRLATHQLLVSVTTAQAYER